MAISNPQAVDFGYLVAFAEGMYVPGSITPHDEPRVAAAGWDIVGHLIARDSILPDASNLPPRPSFHQPPRRKCGLTSSATTT
jgi:hypothetical protein